MDCLSKQLSSTGSSERYDMHMLGQTPQLTRADDKRVWQRQTIDSHFQGRPFNWSPTLELNGYIKPIREISAAATRITTECCADLDPLGRQAAVGPLASYKTPLGE
jgi:hypothetical protein